MDLIGPYINTSHGGSLASFFKFLETMDIKQISSDLYRNNLKKYFEFDEKAFKQKCGTAIGSKFAPSYAISLRLILRKIC